VGILPSGKLFCLFHAKQTEIKKFFFVQFQFAWHSITVNKKLLGTGENPHLSGQISGEQIVV